MDPGRVSGEETWAERPTWRAYVLGVVVVVAANAPLVLWASAFSGRGAGDARTHAMLAHVIARYGLPHGWTGAYGGGFPVGPHYPFVGWGLSALLVKAGLAPMVAVDVVGCASILGVPLAAVVLALRAGARLFGALACALFLSWISPAGYFVSGYEAFYGQGLLSQVLVIPSVVVLIAAIARADSPWKATLPAVVAVACHPQIAIAGLVALALPVVASRDRGTIERYLRAGLATVLVGAAVYGPGIATLKIPFGWPPMDTWRKIGFGTDHLGPWLLEGQLIDVARAPVLTAIWGASMLVVLVRSSRPAARAAAILSVVTMALAVSGSALQSLGAFGAFLLSFLQPLRVLSLVPLVAAVTVLVAIEEAAPAFRDLYARAAARLALAPGMALRGRPLLEAALLVFFALAALPERFTVAHIVRGKVHGILEAFGPDAPCGPPVSASSPPRAVKSWASSLVGGRLWYDDTASVAQECEFATGFEIDASVPIAVTSGVGAHVGVHQVAFHDVLPDRPGSARRAEALGIRHLLLFTGEPAGAGWEVAHLGGDVVVAERKGGTDIVGVGCIASIWAGSDDSLRTRLFADLATWSGARALLDPHVLVALETVGGEWTERAAPPAGCSAEGAEVKERPREPGALEADVETPSPVDVVLRVAAFPTWRVLVDGEPTPTTTVAPGFPSVRLAAGKHHIEAVVAPLPGYLGGIFLALLGALLVSLSTSRFARARDLLARRLRPPPRSGEL